MKRNDSALKPDPDEWGLLGPGGTSRVKALTGIMKKSGTRKIDIPQERAEVPSNTTIKELETRHRIMFHYQQQARKRYSKRSSTLQFICLFLLPPSPVLLLLRGGDGIPKIV